MTDFDTTTYPLSDETSFKPNNTTVMDILDDGSPRVRTLSADTFCRVSCAFQPMEASSSAAFHTYLVTNRATELELTYNGETWRGYIEPETAGYDVEGPWHWWTLSFYGKAV